MLTNELVNHGVEISDVYLIIISFFFEDDFLLQLLTS